MSDAPQLDDAPNLSNTDEYRIGSQATYFLPGSSDESDTLLHEGIQSLLVVDVQVETRLVRRLDWKIMPILGLMYLCSSLDRANVGNAQSDGMGNDLHLVGQQYSIMLTAFYIPFCCLSIPGVMLSKRVGAHRTMPGYMIGWAIMCMFNAAVKNFAGLLIVRLLLGAFEAGFAPTLISYLTGFYKRDELGQRICGFYSMLAISGAFSGLLSYSIFQLDTSLKGWRLLFLIEGALTLIVAVVSIYLLPWDIMHCSFLTEEESKCAHDRLLQDSSDGLDDSYDPARFMAPLREPEFIVYVAIALCYGTTGAVAANFLPQVIERMQFSSVKTNLYTVGPNALAAVCVLVTARSSDHRRERSLHLISAMFLTFVGLVMLAVVPTTNVPASFIACFLMSAGAFTPSVIFHTWHNNNDASPNGRAFRTAALTLAANAGGIVSANIFLSWEKPHYTTAIAVSAFLEAVGIALVLMLREWMKCDNSRRDRVQGIHLTSRDVPTSSLKAGTNHPSFRYLL